MIDVAELTEVLQQLSEAVRRLTVLCQQAGGEEQRLLLPIIRHMQPLIQELSGVLDRTLH